LRLQAAGRFEPFADERPAFRVGESEEVMLRGLDHRLCARERRIRILQFGRGVNGAAVFAGVTVLVLGAAVGALALDVAIGEEHALHGVVELLDRLRIDEAGAFQAAKDALRELGVLRRVRRMPVVVGDMEAVEILAAAACDVGDEGFGRLPGLLGGEHDRRAVCVVGAHEMHGVSVHALETHPDVGLDVLHDVADVKRRVGIRQRRGHE
jgi:hypothetical protein